jgi:hypothetical protein
MDPKFEMLLLQFDQPDKSVWDEILSFAENWNRTKENKFINDEPSELAIYFFEEDDKELKELENILEQKHEERQWAWIKTITNDPTKEEIEAHDYIQIIGDGYPDEFFLNESDALSPMIPCKTCGTMHSHLRVQKKPVQVNEVFLNKKGEPNDKYTPRGLDIINLSHGALLVSKKVVELVKKNSNFHGCTFFDVIDQKGKISDRLCQLKADKVILLPDNLTEVGAICPTCGTVLSTMTRMFVVKESRLGKSSFFSRIPSGLSSIYISNPLYHLFKLENIRGLTPVQGAALIFD